MDNINTSSQYADTLKKYKTGLTNQVAKDAIEKILLEKLDANRTKKIYKEIYNCIDLTSLNSTDTKEKIYKLVEAINADDDSEEVPNVAAICVFPNFVSTVRETLTADIKVASVAGGFPSSQTFTEVKIAEAALAVADGADEIDVVANLGNYIEENYEELCEDLMEIKQSCRGAKVKVILETGALDAMSDVVKLSLLALYSGADFIKTSTGKGYAGASYEAVFAMCYALKAYTAKTKQKAGIKVSGGVSTAEEALKYYTIVKEVMGEDFMTNEYFRIGASSLVDSLKRVIKE